MNSKREETSREAATVKSEAESDLEQQEPFEATGIHRPSDTKEMLMLTNLHENELERQLQNLTPIVSNIILANLLRLSEDDVRV